ncbi:glycosyltransferase family 9 protein [Prauserella muralis]|uniref:Glycosyl transferase n=1 Tax=Prauserella muralis TaxID=588067 RepID=A0A2V4AZJ6_9PSEU|nr:glycosyltransferase family 9 protein [Prauserella muralis]PXY27316.1 glycosyl transferase [Prauserella muralis]TWE23005.1 ADP-heptose:LPS heptosyltransferase [Prauserella muralis]
MAVTSSPPERGTVLVLRALGLGDLLTAVPALRALRRARPGDRLVLAAPDALRPLASLSATVDELLPTPGLGALDWRGEPPALAVNLHGSGPESIADLLTTRPAGLITHRHPGHPDVPGPEWPAGAHEVDRWCSLLEWHGIPADRTDLGLAEPDTPSPAPGAVVIHPGAAYPARRWPAERFAEVARALSGHPVIVTGSDAERPLAEQVAALAGLPPESVLAGRTGLDGLSALVAGAALVVCGDTGVGHLATAFGTPSVLLFGPTPPHRWGPPPERPRHVALWAGIEGDPFAERPDPGLLRLTPRDVLSAARRLLPEGTHV